jgi:hypothetical protein
MYGLFNAPNNVAPAHGTTNAPQAATQLSPSQSAAPPTRVFFTSPSPVVTTDEFTAPGTSFTLYSVSGPPPQQQQQQYITPGAGYASPADLQWSAVPQLYSSVVPSSPSTVHMVVQQTPHGNVGRSSTEPGLIAGTYTTSALASPPLTVISREPQPAAATSYTTFVGADTFRGYTPSSATTATALTPLYLTGVNDSRRGSVSMGTPQYVDSTANHRASSVLYQPLNNCSVSQPALGSPPVPVSTVLAPDVASFTPSASTSVALSLPSARETALDTPTTFFTAVGSAFTQPAEQHPQSATTHYALPQQLTSHLPTTYPSMSGAAAAGEVGGTRPTVQAILIEQPMMQHTTQHFLHSAGGGGQAAVAVPGTPGSSLTSPTNATIAVATAQHFDPVAAERGMYPFSQSSSHRTSFPSTTFQHDQPPLRPPREQQQQQQQWMPPFASPRPSVFEHTRPVIAQADRKNSTSAMINECLSRTSLSSGPSASRRPTRISFNSLNSAALGNSVNDYTYQPQHPPQQRSTPGLPSFQRSPHHSPSSVEEQEKSLQLQQQQSLKSSLHALPRSRQQDLLLQHSASSATASATLPAQTAAVTAAVNTPDPAQAITSPPTSPSRNIARRNRDKAVLFVGQLNYEATEADVAQVFSCYGKPLSVVVLKDKGKSARRGGVAAAAAGGAAHGGGGAHQRKVGGSAFVTYCSTMEADTAIMALHGRYNAKDDDPDNDDEAKYLQVSYGQQTGLISTFGTIHAEKLHASKPENPIPLIVLERRKASAALIKAEEKQDT